MTIEVPPTAEATVVENTPTKTPVENIVASDEAKTEEPTLSIQIEPPTTIDNPEDLATSNEEKPTSAKRKALFNNPFKITKKEATAETPAHTAPEVPKESAHAEEKAAAAAATGVTTGTGENKITKGLGNLYTRIKQTASSHNIKDIAGTSPPTAGASSEPIAQVKEDATAAASAEKKTTSSSSSSSSSSEGDAPVHEAETPSASANHSSTNKRQSLLSKLFGGGAKKKEEEHTETEHTTREVNTNAKDLETPSTAAAVVDPDSEERPASPPLSRRVTGFFAKKIPSYNKKHQKEKAENIADEHAVTQDVTPDNTTTTIDVVVTQEDAELATGPEADAATAETTTNKDTAAPVTTSA